jgi:beta-1,4-N-acetylglucosaminyltransferase
MIFVTVGSMAEFDSLVEAIDKIASKLNEKIIMQIGNGKYIPKNCEYFRYNKNLSKYMKKANLIITHGGAGTIFEILRYRKPMIGIENVDVNGSHQWDILSKLEDKNYIIWCKNLEDMERYIIKAKKMKFDKYVQPKCTIHEHIKTFLEKCK